MEQVNTSNTLPYNTEELPSQLRYLYREKLGIPDSIDTLLAKYVEKRVTPLTENEINNALKFYKWWFSDNLFTNSLFIELLIKNWWVLCWYLTIWKHRSDELDSFIEKTLMKSWLLIDDIALFISFDQWKYLVQELESIETEDWKYDFIIDVINNIIKTWWWI